MIGGGKRWRRYHCTTLADRPVPGRARGGDNAQGNFDIAAVLTNDTDLVEPMRIVSQELGMHVTLLTPASKPATSLVNVATSVRHIQPYIGPCQMPDPVSVPGKKPIAKPASW